MEVVIMQRDPFQSDHTYGALYYNGEKLCDTAELPWKGNIRGVSCIPDGEYNVVKHNSENHPNTWELLNVPNRFNVLIHNGNIPSVDSLGCILVGKKGKLDDKKAVLDSVNTLNHLRDILPSTFVLKIINADNN